MGNTQFTIKFLAPQFTQGYPYIFTIGLPLKKGFLYNKDKLLVLDQDKNSYVSELTPLLYWPDKSIKWCILDIFIAKPIKNTTFLFLETSNQKEKLQEKIKFNIEKSEQKINLSTGSFYFVLDKNLNSIFKNIDIDFSLTTKNNKKFSFQDLKEKNINFLHIGRLRIDIEIKGKLLISGKKYINLRFIISFFYHSSIIKIDAEIHNPNPSIHPSGKWDLGDPGSIFFKDFSILYKLDKPIKELTCYIDKTKNKEIIVSKNFDKFIIHQNSSGGTNWNSPNHIDKEGNLTVKFKGFFIHEYNDGCLTKKISGDRINPLIIAKSEKNISFSIKNFWQNFPKSIKVQKDLIKLSLFPKQTQILYELQGGEKKTHTIYIDIDSDENGERLFNFMFPPNFEINPYWVHTSETIPYFVPEEQDSNENYLRYIKNIIIGPNSFFKKNEVIDEYGWRNFGDIFSDHEAVNHKGDTPFVSHYNNQYDFLYGAIVHFLRSGDFKWFELLEPLAKHTFDIDIYHTDKDKAAYNHGMFWHTDHYVEAKTATHRTYSRLNPSPGGGPSNEHNYTTGLLYFYLLTGNIQAKEAVLELANWVIEMDKGDNSLFCILDHDPTGLASQTVDPMFHRPGRGAGNSINALIDAYILTNNRKYLFKAEELIRRTIHPKDDIEKLNLDDPEFRWSYLVYLQILDKYLCLKLELNEIDWMYFYGRDSLIHYGRWILKNEVPYKDVLHKVEIPTETWPAQDIRKAYVLNCVTKYISEKERKLFLEKAKFFFNRCLDDLLKFNTAYLTRPMVILCVFGFQQAYFDNLKNHSANRPLKHNYDFGEPEIFVPQKYRWKTTFRKNIKTFSREIKRIFIEKIWQIKQKLPL